MDPFGLKPQLNLFPKEDPLHIPADQVPTEEDVFIIVGHGNSYQVVDENENYLNAAELWSRIKWNVRLYPGFKGDNCTIKLLVCSAGKGKNSIAEQLSRLSGCKVLAPEKYWGWHYTEDNQLIEYGVKIKGKEGLHEKLREFPERVGP